MKVQVRNACDDFKSYRAARVKSLFNVESGANFALDADLAIDDDGWQIGVVVGPSGSGKTSIGRSLFGGKAFYAPKWAKGPIVDGIAPKGDFDAVTGALAAVGLGNVPSWLRPYDVLSMGEKFRADMARLVVEAPKEAVIDEFTSVVDRQIARIGALAFQKAWRRNKGCKVVLLTPHHDVLDWLEPDWIFDTATGAFERAEPGRRLRRRPSIELEIVRTNWRYWPEFEPHHYLAAGPMPAGICYIGLVGGERVCHLGMASINKGDGVEARACRLVVKPEWQGAGVGMRFLNWVCELQRQGGDGCRLQGRRVTTMFHTSHPGLAAALARDPKWRRISAVLHGASKAKSRASIQKSRRASGSPLSMVGTGYGGHFRAVQGFRYYGPRAA